MEEINEKINAITAEISEKYPELLKYISEMPITMPNQANPEITKQKLKDYYNSLKDLMADYAATHEKKN